MAAAHLSAASQRVEEAAARRPDTAAAAAGGAMGGAGEGGGRTFEREAGLVELQGRHVTLEARLLLDGAPQNAKKLSFGEVRHEVGLRDGRSMSSSL